MDSRFVVVGFDEKKVKRLEWAHDLCLGRLYVVKIDNPEFNKDSQVDEFNCESYFVDCVYVGSERVYNEEGEYIDDTELFAELGTVNVHKVTEPKFRVFLDDQYNIRSRYYN